MLTTRKKNTKGPFTTHEVYYNDSFLDYIWQPKKFSGPNGEKFLVPHDTIFNTPDLTSANMKAWNWFFTLDEAKEFLLTTKFAGKL